jgi:CHAD domain-containing protein
MALTLKPDEKPGKGLRRIAHGRLQKLLNTFSARDMGCDENVHDARKQVKELRCVLRLARDELGKKAYRRENQALRDAVRPLADLRDATVLIDTLDELIERSRGRLKAAPLAPFRRNLQARRQQARTQIIHNKVALARCLQGSERRIKGYPARDGSWKLVRGSMRRIYLRGQTAMRAAHAARSNEALHEWRKRTNAVRYALEILRCRRPKKIRRFTQRAHRLTDILGADHDLAVLSAAAQQEGGVQAAADAALLLSLIAERRLGLQKRAAAIGGKLFSDTGRRFVRELLRGNQDG